MDDLAYIDYELIGGGEYEDWLFHIATAEVEDPCSRPRHKTRAFQLEATAPDGQRYLTRTFDPMYNLIEAFVFMVDNQE